MGKKSEPSHVNSHTREGSRSGHDLEKDFPKGSIRDMQSIHTPSRSAGDPTCEIVGSIRLWVDRGGYVASLLFGVKSMVTKKKILGIIFIDRLVRCKEADRRLISTKK